jgi:hypothetical protein
MKLKEILLAAFIAMVILVAFVKHERNFIRMNGETYYHAGMAELQPGIFIPVYRRLK